MRILSKSLISGPARAARLFHTVRYLKPVQIYGRVRNSLPASRLDTSAAALTLRRLVAPVAGPIECPRSLTGRWHVNFLNSAGTIATTDQWNDPAKPKLWLYNLHYFDDLTGPADAAHNAVQRDFVLRWIAENPAGAGNGWEPYPASLRIVNWVKWALAGEALDNAMQQSLALQTRWLANRLEWHLLGNHLMANAKALVFAGLFFTGAEAERWLARGLAIMAEQLPEQILADGGHFELSPMYHAIILEDVLDLINLSRSYGVSAGSVWRDLPNIATRMRHWLAAMTHPDGGLSFFNDAAFGIAASRADLEAYAQRLSLPEVAESGEGVHHLASSGYVRVNRGAMAAILDVGAVGPDYIPGHAHADTLSFELSLGTSRVIVNGGTSTYAAGSLREAQRSTHSHSTVEVNGENSSEVWAAFRVARRACIRDLSVAEQADGGLAVRATQDGYRRLAGAPDHSRVWEFGANCLTITDEVRGGGPHQAIARYHLHPLVVCERERSDAVRLRSNSGQTISIHTQGPVEIVETAWHPEFGTQRPSQSLQAALVDGQHKTRLAWS